MDGGAEHDAERGGGGDERGHECGDGGTGCAEVQYDDVEHGTDGDGDERSR